MYCGRDYAPAQQGESEVYGYNFVNDLATGDSIAGSVWALTVVEGTDANPSSHLINAPWVESATLVNQRISGLLAGVTYAVQITATTALNNTLIRFTHIEGVATS